MSRNVRPDWVPSGTRSSSRLPVTRLDGHLAAQERLSQREAHLARQVGTVAGEHGIGLDPHDERGVGRVLGPGARQADALAVRDTRRDAHLETPLTDLDDPVGARGDLPERHVRVRLEGGQRAARHVLGVLDAQARERVTPARIHVGCPGLATGARAARTSRLARRATRRLVEQVIEVDRGPRAACRAGAARRAAREEGTEEVREP